MPFLDHVNRHVHARVKLVPDFAGVVGLDAFAHQQKHFRLGDVGEAGAAEVHAGDRGVGAVHGVNGDAVLRGDPAHQPVDFGIVEIAALPAQRNENSALLKVDGFPAAAGGGERLRRHLGPHAGVEQPVQRPWRIVVRPGEEIGEAGLGGFWRDWKFGADFPADHIAANIPRIEWGVIEVESQRQRPGGHIVEGFVFKLGDQLEQRLDHAVLGLIGLHQVGIRGGEAHPAGFNVPVQALHADLVPVQQVERVVGPGGVARRGKNIGFHFIAGREFRGLAGEIALELQQLAAHFDAGADHFHRGAVLRADIVPERQDAVRRFEQPFAAGLFEQHAHAGVHVGIGRSLADVEVVESLLVVVEALLAVEPRAGPVGHRIEQFHPSPRHIGKGAVGHAGVEVVGAVFPHFVVIGVDVRPPFMKLRHPAPGLGMLENQPLPVEVEPVMVGAAAGPEGVVQLVPGVRDRHVGAVHMVPGRHPAAAIGIEYGDEDDDALFQRGFDFSAPGRGQMIGHRHRRVGGAHLGAVDAVIEPSHHRHVRAHFLVAARVAQGDMGGLDRIEALVVFRAGDDQTENRAALMGMGDILHRDSGRHFRQGAQIPHQQVVAGDALAQGVADDRLRERNVWVEIDLGRIERRGPRGGLRHRDRAQHPDQQQNGNQVFHHPHQLQTFRFGQFGFRRLYTQHARHALFCAKRSMVAESPPASHVLEKMAVSLAGAEFFPAVAEGERVAAAEVAAGGGDLIDADDDAAVDAPELAGVKLRRQLADGAAQQVFAVPGDGAGVFGFGAEVDDLIDRDQHRGVAKPGAKPLQVVRRRADASPLEQGEQLFAILAFRPPQARDGRPQPFIADRFEQIVHRRGAEGFDGELVKGGNKDDPGAGGQGGCHFEPRHAGQADIEEGDIGLRLPGQAQRLAAFAHHADDIQLRPQRGQLAAQLLRKQRFVFNNQRGGHTGRALSATTLPALCPTEQSLPADWDLYCFPI